MLMIGKSTVPGAHLVDLLPAREQATSFFKATVDRLFG